MKLLIIYFSIIYFDILIIYPERLYEKTASIFCKQIVALYSKQVHARYFVCKLLLFSQEIVSYTCLECRIVSTVGIFLEICHAFLYIQM